MATRNVKKSLAGMEDIAQGRGSIEQTRNKELVTIHKLDVPFALGAIAEMSALDVDVYQRARVYESPVLYVDYVYDASDSTGITPDIGVGSWFGVAQGGYRTVAGIPSGVLTPKFVGEEVLDTAGNAFYKAYGLLNTEWV